MNSSALIHPLIAYIAVLSVGVPARDMEWSISDPCGDGLEGHAVVQTFLNLLSLLHSQVLVLSGVFVLHLLWSPFWVFPRLSSTTILVS